MSLVAQCPDESPIHLLPRTIRQLTAVEESGMRIARAAILLNQRQDQAAMSIRRLVLLALSKHARAVGSSMRITVCGDIAAASDYHRKIADMVSIMQAESERESSDARIHIGLEPQPDEPAPRQSA